MSQALFYPWIDVPNDAWLKASILYWDSVRTIVPESIDAPYSSDTGRALEGAGFLVPLRVHPDMEEIQELTDDALSYLSTTEGVELIVAENRDNRHDIHVEKLPYRFGHIAELHPEKLPYEIHNVLRSAAAPSERGPEWISVDHGFANFYMTLLASRLAERVGARLLTSLPAADRLAVAARLDAQLNGLIPWRMARGWREYEAYGPRHRMPRHLAPGMLATLAIERMGIAVDTPIDRLIDFRTRHADELALFRAKVDHLAQSVDADLPTEALRQHIAGLYNNEVAPAIANLKAALKGRSIRWMSEGLLKVAFLSAGSSTMLVAAGLAVPTALLAGAGLSLIVSGTMYNIDRRESLRTNPYAYLLSIQQELA